MFRNTNKVSVLSGLLFGLCLPLVATSAPAEEYFTIKDGELERPTGYREWVYVGTPVTPNDLNDGKAAAADDFVFTQYYPVLRAGKTAGE